MTAEWQEYLFFQYLHRLEASWRFARQKDQDHAGHHVFGRRVEALAAEILRQRGHVVSLTSHKAHHDIQAGGARVEVKAATWDGRRWQWNLRRSQADVYLLACCDDRRVLAWYVVPGPAIGGRRNTAVWNEDPAEYAGQWARYLEAWELVDAAATCGAHPWQMALV